MREFRVKSQTKCFYNTKNASIVINFRHFGKIKFNNILAYLVLWQNMFSSEAPLIRITEPPSGRNIYLKNRLPWNKQVREFNNCLLQIYPGFSRGGWERREYTDLLPLFTEEIGDIYTRGRKTKKKNVKTVLDWYVQDLWISVPL